MGNMICTGQCKAISPSICGAWDVGHLESSPTEIAWEPSGISGVGTKLFAVEEERRKQPDSTLLVITIIIIIIDKDLISGSTFSKNLCTISGLANSATATTKNSVHTQNTETDSRRIHTDQLDRKKTQEFQVEQAGWRT